MAITSNYLTVNGVRLHYLRAGHGSRALVLTHGNSHCGGVWAPLVEALAGEQFTVIAVDLPGHGWSEQPESGYDWASLRDGLVGVVTALDLRDVVYVGHSRGGGVSLLAAAATRDRARGALVYEPTMPVQRGEDGGPAPVPEPERIKNLAERAGRRRDLFASREELVTRYRSQDGFREWREDYFAAFLTYGTRTREDGAVELCVPGRVAVRLYEATFGFAAWREVRAPDLPVLALFGDRSGRLGQGRDPVAGLRTLFPHCQSRVIANATHTGPMEQPEVFEQAIRDFAGPPTPQSWGATPASS